MASRRRLWLLIGVCVVLLWTAIAVVTASVLKSRTAAPVAPAVSASAAQPVPGGEDALAFLADPAEDPSPGPTPAYVSRQLGVLIGDTVVAQAPGIHHGVDWTADGRFAFGATSQATITVIDAVTAKVTSISCGCTGAVRFGPSGIAWLGEDGLRTADLAAGGTPVADPRGIPAPPEPRGDSVLLTMAGQDAVLRQTVVLGARLGVEQVIKVAPDGTVSVLLKETPLMQHIRADGTGRIAYVTTVQPVCVVHTVHVLHPDGRVENPGTTGLTDAAPNDAAIVVQDLRWDADGSLHAGGTAGTCEGGTAAGESATWRLDGAAWTVDAGTEGYPMIRKGVTSTYAVTPDGRLADTADRRVLVEGVAEVALSSRRFPAPSAPPTDGPMVISPAGIGPALLGGAAAPLLKAGLFTRGESIMCDTTLSGTGPLAEVTAYTDRDGSIVEQFWIQSPKLTTAAGVHVGSSEAELKKAHGSALRLFRAKENPYVRAYFLDEGGKSVVFSVPDGGAGIDKILVMDTKLAEETIRSLEGFC